MEIQAKPGDTITVSEGVILLHPETGKKYIVKDSNTGTGFIFCVLKKIEYYEKTITNYIEFKKSLTKVKK